MKTIKELEAELLVLTDQLSSVNGHKALAKALQLQARALSDISSSIDNLTKAIDEHPKH